MKKLFRVNLNTFRLQTSLSIFILIGICTSPMVDAIPVNWTGNSGNSAWNDAGNWNPNTNPPSNLDDVTIDLDGSGAAPTVNLSIGPVTINSLTILTGTLNVSASLSIESTSQNSNIALGSILNLQSGIMGGASIINVNGMFIWSGGTLSGSGQTNISSSGSLILNGGAKSLQGRHIISAAINGNGIWTAGNINASNGSVFDNNGVLQIQGDVTWQHLGGALGIINNSGSIIRNVASGLAVLNAAVNNAGTLEVQNGTLRLDNGGTSTGTFASAAGAGLEFSGGTHEINTGGILNNPGTIRFTTNSISNFNANSVYNSNNTEILSGTVNFNSTAVSVTNFLTLNRGTLGGSGILKVNGDFHWSAGTLSGSGQTHIESSGSLIIDGDVSKNLQDRRLVNASTTNKSVWTMGDIFASPGTIFDNSGVFHIQANNNWQKIANNDPGIINNSGTLVRNIAGGFSTLNTVFNNSGTVEVHSGTLRLIQGGISSGMFTSLADATLEFGGGVHELNAGGIPDAAGSIGFSAGTVNINDTSVYNTANTLINGGIANFNLSVQATTSNLVLSSGTLGGTGIVAINGNFIWSGGIQSDNGQTLVSPGGSLIIDGGVKSVRGRHIINNSTDINNSWTAGNIAASLGAVFDNNGIFLIQGDVSWQHLGGDLGSINNRGSIIKNTTNGTTLLGAIFNNTGMLDVQSGTLQLDRGGVSPGQFNVMASLEFTGASHELGPTRNLTGNGNVTFATTTTVFSETRPQVNSTDAFLAVNGPISIDVASIIQPSSGLVSYDGTHFTYDPQGYRGTESFSYTVNGIQGTAVATVTYESTVNPGTELSLNPASFPVGRVGSFFQSDFQVAGGLPPYEITVVGDLPPGLTIDNINKRIKGLPSVAGNYEILVTVMDAAAPPTSISKTYSLTIDERSAGLTISNTSLPDGVVGSGYGIQLQNSGGIAPFTWKSVDVLPQGLSLDYTGYLTGVLQLAGAYEFRIEVTDSQNSNTAANFSLTILAQGLQNRTPNLPDAIIGQQYSVPILVNGGMEPYYCTTDSNLDISGFILNNCTLRGQGQQDELVTFNVQVSDSHQPALALQIPFTLRVRSVLVEANKPPPVIDNQAVDLGSINLNLGKGDPGEDYPDEHLNAMTRDAFGHVYVVGYAFNGHDYALHTMKLATDGRDQPLWHRVLDTPSHDYGYGIAVAPDQSVYVGGYYLKSNVYTGLLVKYDNQGILQWQQTYVTGQQVDTFYALMADESAVYAVGERYNGRNFDAHIVKFDTLGNIVWENSFPSEYNGTAYAIAQLNCDVSQLDPCPIAVSGAQGEKVRDAWMALIDPESGEILDSQVVMSGAVIEAMEVNAADSIYLGFTTTNGRMGALKTNNKYEQLWSKLFDNDLGKMRLRAIKVDLADNVYIIGSQNNGSNMDIQIVVYNSDGVLQGNRQLDESQNEIARGAIIDANQNLIISGESTGSDGSSFLIRRFPTGYSQ